MKIFPRDAHRFMAKPPQNVRAILLFGENAGLAEEYAARLTANIAPDPKDHERIVELSASDLRKDPARLSDEAAQMSMFSPGRRVLRIRDATEGMGEIFSEFLKNPSGDALIIVEAGELAGRAGLRTVFENNPAAAAVACYEDTTETFVELVLHELKSNNIAVETEIAESLVARLGLDRRILRGELQKLEVYFGPESTAPRKLTKALVDELFGQSGDVDASEIAGAVAYGDFIGLDRMLIKAEESGASATYLVSSALRHLHALLAAKALGAGDDDVNAARQRGLWGHSDTAIRGQLKLWTPERLAAAVRVLGQAEGDTRTTVWPDWPLASRALLHAARLAR